MCIGRTTLSTLVLFASTLGGLASCATTTDALVDDPRIIGSWQALGDEATFIFTPTGIYTMSVRDLARPVVGPYGWDRDTGILTLETRRESAVCGDDTGVYRVRLGQGTLDAQVERETCSVRAKLLSKPLRRVGAR